MSNITLHRRCNVLQLFQAYAEAALANGTPPKGLEQSFAQQLEISPSLWSQIKTARPIGDKLARQIEQHCQKPKGWLDVEQAPSLLTAGEQRFLALALGAYRALNATDRRALQQQLQAAVKAGKSA